MEFDISRVYVLDEGFVPLILELEERYKVLAWLPIGNREIKRSMSSDIHKDTASAVFDTPQTEVTSEQRNVAKAINFGVMYGRAAWQRQ